MSKAIYRVETREDYIMHKVNPSVGSTVYTKDIYLFGIRIQHKSNIIDTTYNDKIFDKESDPDVVSGFVNKK